MLRMGSKTLLRVVRDSGQQQNEEREKKQPKNGSLGMGGELDGRRRGAVKDDKVGLQEHVAVDGEGEALVGLQAAEAD